MTLPFGEVAQEVQALRDDLHAQAFALNARGRTEAAQALWGVVESIDALLIRLQARRRS